MKMRWILLLLICVNFSLQAQHGTREFFLPEDIDSIVKEGLESDGVELEVHGAYDQLGIYVLTWRNPEAFFNFKHYPMYSTELNLTESTLRRHDFINIKGSLESRRVGPAHIATTNLDIVRRYEGHGEIPDRDSKVLEDLPRKGTLKVMVHFVSDKVLVAEYKDFVVPMFINGDVKGLEEAYRGDVVEVEYFKLTPAAGPPHFMLRDQEVKTLYLIQDLHVPPEHSGEEDSQTQMTGCLVKFPISPVISIDVYAALQIDDWGYERNFTIVNFDFENPEIFKEGSKKIAKAWEEADQSKIEFRRGRFINCSVMVQVDGEIKIFDSNQANPQMHYSSVEAINFI